MAKGIIDSHRDFIKKAVPKDHKGVFAAKAKAAGMSTAAYAKKEEHAKGRLGKEARLAQTLGKLRGRR